MSIDIELKKINDWINYLPKIGIETLGSNGEPTFILDLIIIGVIKRSLSLASGLHDLVKSKNMTCSRAILRMELDTVSRLLAYTYIDEPPLPHFVIHNSRQNTLEENLKDKDGLGRH